MMKMKRILAFWLVTVLLVSGLVGFANIQAEADNTGGGEMKNTASLHSKSPTAHAPISIDSNSDFTSANGVTSGSGTETDPYIIENWDINASSANGIKIRNTDVYFIIRNCVIHASYQPSVYWVHAVYFYNVTNGKIKNCEIYNSSGYGIYLESSSNNNTISANQIYHNYWDGICLYSSSNNNISANQIHNNSRCGILLSSSPNNNITGNHIHSNSWDGICLSCSSNNNITDNTFTNDGVAISGSSDGCILTIENNTVNSKPLYYFLNETAVTLNGTAVGQLILVNCTNFNIKNLEISYTDVGINLLYSSNNNVTGNQIHNNSYGIFLSVSWKNNISANQIHNNSNYGITLLDSFGPNIITGNQIHNNKYGICLKDSSATDIYYNNIYNNTDYGVFSYGFAYATYNWWGSPNGPGQHYANPVSSNVRYEPWLLWRIDAILPNAIISANPIVVEIGNPITFDGSASYDLDGNVTQYYFDFGDGSNTGWIDEASKSHLYMTSGVYAVTLEVKDDDGAISTDYVNVIVGQPSTPDNQLPVVDAGSDITVYENEPVLFNASANDSDGYIIYYQWDFDGDGGYDWNSTDTGVTVHGYAVNGTYYAELRVYDNQGGFSTGTKTIIVKEGYAQTVSISGGTVEYNNIIIIVPEGAATQNVTFTITKISTANPLGYIIIGDVCRIETDITEFNQPMTLILPYNESNLPANVSEDDLAIYKKVGNSWVKLDSTVDTINNTVSTVVTGFSDYAIFYKQVSILPVVGCIGCGFSEIPWLYIIILVIIIIALIGAGFGIKKKTSGKTKKNTMEIRCPSCKTMFEVEKQEKPFKVKCQKCGKEGTIK